MMRRLKSTITYQVPSWPYCNSDKLTFRGEMTDGVCQFCLISRGGVRCTLYNDDLSVKAGLIEKLPKCCRATDGKGSEIISDEVPPDAPTIPPSDLMKQTLDLYSKTVKDLMAQGYPRSIAETAARKHILGGN